MDIDSSPPPYTAQSPRASTGSQHTIVVRPGPKMNDQVGGQNIDVHPHNTLQTATEVPQLNSLSLRLRHILHLNPGFCPGAHSYRRANASVFSWRDLPSRCTHCGAKCDLTLPYSFAQNWPTFSKLSFNFYFGCHVPVKRPEEEANMGCVICWEKERKWVGPMALEQWGVHMRGHFEGGQYWVCENMEMKVMNYRWMCKIKKCRGIHS
ncbi:hypothetical protein CC86DRAFT_411895 [Ophiobolus disseminans]|uniref:Uncharacterized protein n=1 Tax=Ophiobolus disseminans TaxID=1469910 RepID=A0A6A6ZK54_9PLEO|nr:hypothetical protein CC86DRAFT_411895 [Ophiobolus disseminans]